MSKSREDEADRSAGSLAPGSKVRSYRMTALRRSGSFSDVYSAQHVETGETVAIKFNRHARCTGPDSSSPDESESNDSTADPLRREAEILSKLRHPNIVRIQESWEEDGRTYLVLEDLAGSDLETALRSGEADLDEAALRELLRSLVDATRAVHEAGFLHRDLKPGNIMLRDDGSPVIVDFGSAGSLDHSASANQSWTEATAGYAAPEQYLENGKEGPWTDIYSLGATAYRVIAGIAPPVASDRQFDMSACSALDAGRGRYSDALLQAIDGALELAPKDRPQSVHAWEQSLFAASIVPNEQAQGASQEQGDPADDPYPPTERLERVPAAKVAPAPSITLSNLPRQKSIGRRALVVLVLVVLAAGAGALGWFSWPLYLRYFKQTWIVDVGGSGDSLTVSEALSQARDDATIVIRPGVYRESLALVRPAHLQAEQGVIDAPIIAPPFGPCLVATTLTGSVVGLRFEGASSPGARSAEGVPCVDLAHGELLIEDNEISSPSGPGVRVREGADPTIRRNKIGGTAGPGLTLLSGARGTIVNNIIEDTAKSGIIVRGGASPHISDNLIEDSGQAGALFAEGAGGLFTANTVRSSGESGIEITGGADPVVSNNLIEASGGAGVFIYDLGRGWLQGNQIVSSTLSGLAVMSGAAPRFVSNVVRDGAEHGVLAIEPSGGVVTNNRVANNDGHGIVRVGQSDVALDSNELEGNKEPQVLESLMPEPATVDELN